MKALADSFDVSRHLFESTFAPDCGSTENVDENGYCCTNAACRASFETRYGVFAGCKDLVRLCLAERGVAHYQVGIGTN